MINEQDYVNLRMKLSIDLARLDESLIIMPMLQMEIAEKTAAAAKARDEAKALVEVVTADTAAKIRNTPGVTKVPSEATIKSEIPLYQEVQDAETSLREVEHDYSLWRGLADSMQQKSKSIAIIADLIKCGYMTGNTIREDRKQILQNERVRVCQYDRTHNRTGA